MIRREIEIDEETDRILTELALEYQGDLGQALADLVHSQEGMELLADETEAGQENSIRTLRDKGEADIREGRTVSWEHLKVKYGL